MYTHIERAKALIAACPALRTRRFFSELTITAMREQLTDLGRDIKAMQASVAKMAMDPGTPLTDLQAKQGELVQMRSRFDALRDVCEQQEAEQAGQARQQTPTADPQASHAASLFSSAGDFFQSVARHKKNPDPRMQKIAEIKSAATGQNIGVDADGGFLVPPEYAEGLLKLVQTQSILAQKVQRVPISGNRLIVNKLKDEDRTDGNRGGGLQAFWTGEAEQYQVTKAQFEQDQTDLHKLTGLCYATDEMLEDETAMGAYLSQGFADEFAYKLDDALLCADGDGKPLGILDAANTALVTIPKETGQKAGTVVLQNILKMYNAMPAANRVNAEWYINQDIELVLLQMLMNTGEMASADLSASFGVPVFLPAGGLSASPYGHLLGRPLVPLEQSKAVGSVGDIVFADMSQYRMIEKGGLRADTSIHVRFEYGEQAFRFTLRVGGKPIWKRPLKPANGLTERSPYVALAARQ
ncbi:phage major capsid protein [Eubacteriales bacterium OttesenSCG-928-A19]|nr:phage major capsid protein [Eubacteriales bacterium OttesenSCG-928-A19]